ncbi:hypothetical protein WJX72_006777 [[Myrmecia] bisecta]|uniref:Hemicentin-1-like von Willebrand factor A domain-containing protein n=1 Tax=[Myrmecia] bisecta TaxID=41462 RepID=A0AAW1QFN2_9CHLO
MADELAALQAEETRLQAELADWEAVDDETGSVQSLTDGADYPPSETDNGPPEANEQPSLVNHGRSLQGGSGLATRDETAAIVAASRARQQSLSERLDSAQEMYGTEAVLRNKVAKTAQLLETAVKGVDIAFVMDVTGSMDPWIDAAKSKVTAIMEAAETIHSGAVTRMAFVGYRDLEDARRYEVLDFVSKEETGRLKAFLHEIVATGGDDACEDVAGALKQVLALSWMASTKLVIHIADAPCHGARYHHNSLDYHLEGDPSGLVPEELLQQLCASRVSVYFGRINASTDKMTGIFAGVPGELLLHLLAAAAGLLPGEVNGHMLGQYAQ